ncbi:hypothetical protein AB3S75_047201 [Citrus x aurantiifolia]
MDLGVFQELLCKCNGKSSGISLSRNPCRDNSFLDTTTKAKHQRKYSQKHTKNLSKMAVKNLRVMLSCGSTHSKR